MRARYNRLGRVKQAIEEAPVRRHVLKEAYEVFQWFGELPDEDHVADAVLRRALRGGTDEPVAQDRGLAAAMRAATDKLDRQERAGGAGAPPNVREPLFCEAMDDNPYTRDIARAAIAVEVAGGGNVEDPAFASQHGLPKHNSVALHVLGYPQKWVRPPYEEQAARLFAREDEMRERIPSPRENPEWFDAQTDAILEFYRIGALPEDELRCEALLAHIELDAIVAHKKGRDVGELMALLDRAARGEGEEREGALRKVCAMAAEGRLGLTTSSTSGQDTESARSPGAT